MFAAAGRLASDGLRILATPARYAVRPSHPGQPVHTRVRNTPGGQPAPLRPEPSPLPWGLAPGDRPTVPKRHFLRCSSRVVSPETGILGSCSCSAGRKPLTSRRCASRRRLWRSRIGRSGRHEDPFPAGTGTIGTPSNWARVKTCIGLPSKASEAGSTPDSRPHARS
jgi:hypothetical protein